MTVQELFEKLQVNPDNPRQITTEAFTNLKESILEDPWMLAVKPIIYNSKYIIQAGNMRYKALEDLIKEGFELKDDYFKFVGDLTEEQLRRYVIKDNWEAGDWDYDELANKWSDLPLDKWGLDMTQWEKDKETKEDEPPSVDEQSPPISNLGEVYQLGRHRLACMDSTVKENVDKLLSSA